MQRLSFLKFLLILTSLFGCTKETIITEPVKTDDNKVSDALILVQYESWASASKSQNYSLMKSLVVPGSNFDGATDVCKKIWDDGGEFYYKFSNLVVTELYETSAAVDGEWQIIQGGDPADNYSGIFESFCSKRDNKWLLNGLNFDPD